MADTLSLGTPVAVTQKLFREHRKAVWNGQMRWSKVWTPVPWLRPEEKQGVIVGVRTVSSGWTQTNGYEDPSAWIGEEYLTVYLVAFDLRRKPMHVAFEHVEEMKPASTSTSTGDPK